MSSTDVKDMIELNHDGLITQVILTTPTSIEIKQSTGEGGDPYILDFQEEITSLFKRDSAAVQFSLESYGSFVLLFDKESMNNIKEIYEE